MIRAASIRYVKYVKQVFSQRTLFGMFCQAYCASAQVLVDLDESISSALIQDNGLFYDYILSKAAMQLGHGQVITST